MSMATFFSQLIRHIQPNDRFPRHLTKHLTFRQQLWPKIAQNRCDGNNSVQTSMAEGARDMTCLVDLHT
jgi:hypothetical protein